MTARRLLILLVGLLSVATSLSAQEEQDAFFVYRNDGDFNAFNFAEIDSITYSSIQVMGTDSVLYDQAVTQIIWTADSVYRIPIEAVDSVGLTAPETIINKDVFMLTADHVPYLTKADTLHFTLAPTTPEALRPQRGNIVVAEPECTAFANGIIARVLTVTTDASGFHYDCEQATLDDVFDQILFCGTAGGGDETTSDISREGPRRAEASINKELWDVKLGGSWEKGKLKASAEARNDAYLKATIRKCWGEPFYFRLDFWMNSKAELSFGAEVEKEEKTGRHQIGRTVKIGKISFPHPLLSKILWFEPQLTLYGYAEAKGKVGFGFNASYKRKDQLSVVYENEKLSIRPISSSDSELSLASLTLEGAVEIGLIPEVLLAVNGSKTGVGITPCFGVMQKAQFNLDGVGLFTDGIYEAIKDTQTETYRTEEASTFAQLSLLGVNAKGATPPKRLETLIKKWYLLPDVTAAGQKDLVTDLQVDLTVARNTLFTTTVGMGLYDEGGNLLKTADFSGEHKSNTDKFQYLFTDIPKSKRLTAYPIVTLAGISMRAKAIPIEYCPAELVSIVDKHDARYYSNSTEPNDLYMNVSARLLDTKNVESIGLYRLRDNGQVNYIGKFNDVSTNTQTRSFYIANSDDNMYIDYNNYVAQAEATVGLDVVMRNPETNETYTLYGEPQKVTLRYDTPPSITIFNPSYTTKTLDTWTEQDDEGNTVTRRKIQAHISFDENVKGSFWINNVTHDCSDKSWDLSNQTPWYPSADKTYSFSYNNNFYDDESQDYSRWLDIHLRESGKTLHSNYLKVKITSGHVSSITTSSTR